MPSFFSFDFCAFVFTDDFAIETLWPLKHAATVAVAGLNAPPLQAPGVAPAASSALWACESTLSVCPWKHIVTLYCAMAELSALLGVTALFGTTTCTAEATACETPLAA